MHVAQPALAHDRGVEQRLLRHICRGQRRPLPGAGEVDLQRAGRGQGTEAKAQSGPAPGGVVQGVARAVVVGDVRVVLDVGLARGIVGVGEGELARTDHPRRALDHRRAGRAGGHGRVIDRRGVEVEIVRGEVPGAAGRHIQGHRRGEVLAAVVDVADPAGIDIGLREALEGAQRDTVLLQAAVPRARGTGGAVERADGEDDLARRHAASGKTQQVARHRDCGALVQQDGLTVGQRPQRGAGGRSTHVIRGQLRTRHRRRVGLAAAAAAGARQRQRETEVEGAQRVGEVRPDVDAALPHEILALRVPAQRQCVVAHLEGETVGGLAAGIVDGRLHVLHPARAYVCQAEGGPGQQLRVVHQQMAVRRRRRENEGDARLRRVDVGGRQHLRREHDPVVVAATVEHAVGPLGRDGGRPRAGVDPHRVVVDRQDVEHDARAGRPDAIRAQPAAAVGDGHVETVAGWQAVRVDTVVGVAQAAAIGMGDDEAAGDVLRTQGAVNGLRDTSNDGQATVVQHAVCRQVVQAQVEHVVARVAAAVGGDEQADHGLCDPAARCVARLAFENAAATGNARCLVDGSDDEGHLGGVGVRQRGGAVVDLHRETVGGVLRGRAAGGVHIGQQAVTQLRQVEGRARADRVAVQGQEAVCRGVGEREDDLFGRLLATVQIGVGERECLRPDRCSARPFRDRLHTVDHGGGRVGHGALQQAQLGGGEPGRIEGQCGVDRPGLLLQHPVALRSAAPGGVIGGSHIGLRQPGDALDQFPSVGARAHAAAIQQDVGVWLQERGPPWQLACKPSVPRRSVPAGIRPVADLHLPRRAVGQQVDGVPGGTILQGLAHLLPGIAAGVEDDHLNAFANVGDVGLVACDRRVDEQDLLACLPGGWDGQGTDTGRDARGGCRCCRRRWQSCSRIVRCSAAFRRAASAGPPGVLREVERQRAVEHEAWLQHHRSRYPPRPQRGAMGIRTGRAHGRLARMRPLIPATSSGKRPSIAAATLTDWLTGSARAPMRVNRAG